MVAKRDESWQRKHFFREERPSGRDFVPVWDGRAETLDEYAEVVRDLVLGTKRDERALIGPRLRAALPINSAARRWAKKVRDEDLTKENGAQMLIEVFRENAGARPLNRFSVELDTLFYNCRRRSGETFPEYAQRQEEQHEKATEALRSVLTADRIAQRRQTVRREGAEQEEEEEDDPLPEQLFDEIIRGFLLWRNSGVPLQVRLSVLNQTRGTFRINALREAFRDVVGDAELRELDRKFHERRAIFSFKILG